MLRTQCVLALVALHVGLAHSWDIAVSVGNQLIFYTDGGTITNTVNLVSYNLTALAYDEVHNMMLYVDKQGNNDAICGYDISSMENKCYIERNGRNIHGLAFDPATEAIFFSDTNEKSINWISLKPGSKNNVYGNLFTKMDDGIPTDIAVDSCNGSIHWRLSVNITKKDRLNEAVIIKGLSSYTIDPQKGEIYFIYNNYSYRTAVLNYGKNLFRFFRDLSAPKVLTVSKDYIYWMDGSESDKTVWQIRKNAKQPFDEPKKFCTFNNIGHIGIAANYKIKDQIQGVENCEPLTSLILNNSDAPFCAHGKTVRVKYGESHCKCTPGYIGGSCDVSVCENYCLQGDCSFNDEGLPKCSCYSGYFGQRCEVYACHGYCLNNGDCSLNEEDQPVCQCVGNQEGTRCEADTNYTFTNTPTYNSAKKNISLVDLLTNWRKPTSKMFVMVEV